MNLRSAVRSKLFTQLSKLESDFGSVMYIRIDQHPKAPGVLLAEQTLYLAPGGTLDILADRTSAMGLDRVGYTPGLRAQRKVAEGRITYRFQVAEDAVPGAAYLVQCMGESEQAAFAFTLQVS